MSKKKIGKGGMTLLEMLAVMAIISIEIRQRTPSESLIQWEVNGGATKRSLFFYLTPNI